MPRNGSSPTPALQLPGDVGAEQHERAVREVDDVHHAPDQGEADGDERQQAALEQAVDRRLEELGHSPSALAAGQATGASASAWSVGQTATALPFWIWIDRHRLVDVLAGVVELDRAEERLGVEAGERVAHLVRVGRAGLLDARAPAPGRPPLASALWYSAASPKRFSKSGA